MSDGTWTYTWENGRQLASMARTGEIWEYSYNADGLRTERSNGTVTYDYIYSGSALIQMTVGNDVLYFTYDAAGTPMSVTYNGTSYYYATNLQGDVIAILDTNGNAVVEYTYDAWGNHLNVTGSMADTLGEINPLRYRGYVYDTETTLYYLQSRYYDPELGRFINADSYASTGQGILGNNMFAYCINNPVIYADPYGYEGFVGFGIQFDYSTDHGTYGFEIVIYLEPDVVEETTDDESHNFVIVWYTYSGMCVNAIEMAVSPQLVEMVSSLDFEELNNMSSDELLIFLAGLFKGYESSGGIFAIYGNDNFESARDYSADFHTYSVTVSNPAHIFSGGVFYSYSDTCWTVGGKVSASSKLKFSMLPFDVQYSHTYYSNPTIIAQG